MKLTELWQLCENEYRGEHEAPDKESGAPLYDITINGIYPPDVYTNGRQYSLRDGSDDHSFNIVMSYHNRPNRAIKIYRAVPYMPGTQQKISDFYKQKAYILKYGAMPPDASPSFKSVGKYSGRQGLSSEYFEWLIDEIKKLEQMPAKEEKKIKINPGDWVTIDKAYAVEHGRDNLNRNYRIITKTVPAKHLYTEGDSILEWGYDPS